MQGQPFLLQWAHSGVFGSLAIAWGVHELLWGESRFRRLSPAKLVEFLETGGRCARTSVLWRKVAAMRRRGSISMSWRVRVSSGGRPGDDEVVVDGVEPPLHLVWPCRTP